MTETTTKKPSKGKKITQKPPLQQWLDELGFAQRQRLRFLEARLLWEGQINRSTICEQFGLTPNHITREISDYRHYFPHNLEYDVTARAYRPTSHFEPHFCTGEPAEYLALLKLYAVNPESAVVSELGSPISAEVLPEPNGKLKRSILQQLLRAIHSDTAVRITYLSFSQSEETERNIWPHAFAWNGDRWHVRAYDDRRQAYIDIVPHRISKASALNEELPTGIDIDHDWLETENVDVIPNPELPKKQQAVIAQEYSMEKLDGQLIWRVTLRRCLVPYFLFRHRLDQIVDQSSKPRIVLKDTELAQRFAFGATNSTEDPSPR